MFQVKKQGMAAKRAPISLTVKNVVRSQKPYKRMWASRNRQWERFLLDPTA
jgi:hypothetical protein